MRNIVAKCVKDYVFSHNPTGWNGFGQAPGNFNSKSKRYACGTSLDAEYRIVFEFMWDQNTKGWTFYCELLDTPTRTRQAFTIYPNITDLNGMINAAVSMVERVTSKQSQQTQSAPSSTPTNVTSFDETSIDISVVQEGEKFGLYKGNNRILQLNSKQSAESIKKIIEKDAKGISGKQKFIDGTKSAASGLATYAKEHPEQITELIETLKRVATTVVTK